MRGYGVIGLIALLGLCLAGPAWAQDAPKGMPLSGAELKALVGNGVLLDWSNSEGRMGTLLLLNGGTALGLSLHTLAGAGTAEEGHWRIQGHTLCLKWNDLPTVESCGLYERNGDNRYSGYMLIVGSKTAMTFSVRK